jgi:hypothetical protein
MYEVSVLLAFRLKNFRSFRDEFRIDLSQKARDAVPGFDFPEITTAAAVFGANASGKSNLLRAMSVAFGLIRGSASREEGNLPYSPFLLGDEDSEPTLFEVSAQLDGIRFDYGFTYTAERVVGEWMYSWPRGRQRTVFERDTLEEDRPWYFGDSLTGPNQALAKATRDDALFLSTSRLLNHEVLGPLHQQLSDLVKVIGLESLDSILQSTLDSLRKDPVRAQGVAKFLARADLGVDTLSIEEGELPPEVRNLFEVIMPNASAEEIQAQVALSSLQPRLTHLTPDGRSVPIPFGWESVGTRSFLALLGPIYDRLGTGGVLVVDEIDTSLHPRLVSQLVRLFVSPKTNPHQAQLIFSTHDVTVMMNIGGYNVLGRDQLWLVEKDDGMSELYPLSRYKARRDEVFSRNYLSGRYGGIPHIDDTNFWDIPLDPHDPES